MNAARVPISFTLDAGTFAGIERRAATMGKKPADYVRSLAEAAYVARVGREKNMPATDRDLDEAVRAVFCLAGEFQERTIAKATGFTEELVRDVLRGFKTVAGEIRERPIAKVKPSETAKTEPTPAKKATSARSPARSAEEITTIKKMWLEGASVKAIADATKRPLPATASWISTHPGICPKRRAA